MTPASFSRAISAACRRAVGTRPLYRPSRFALAIPSRWRSSIKLRSPNGKQEMVFLRHRHAGGIDIAAQSLSHVAPEPRLLGIREHLKYGGQSRGLHEADAVSSDVLSTY